MAGGRHIGKRYNPYYLYLLVNHHRDIGFFMQAGFAFLESGQVRSKNATHVYMKICANIGIGSLVWWLSGFAIFSGNWNYCLLGVIDPSNVDNLNVYGHWFTMWGFCLVSCSIASGAIAERFSFKAYLIYVVLYCGFVYPFLDG